MIKGKATLHHLLCRFTQETALKKTKGRRHATLNNLYLRNSLNYKQRKQGIGGIYHLVNDLNMNENVIKQVEICKITEENLSTKNIHPNQ